MKVVNAADIDGTNGFRLVGGASNGSASGRSVASAGDVNGDGDIVIGLPETSGNGLGGFRGDSHVVFGRAGANPFGAAVDLDALTGANGFSLTAVTASGRSGSSVAAAGDVNGDGIGDLIVQARAYGAFPEQAFIFFGARTITGGADDLLGTDLDERIDGLGGNDTIRGLGGDDTLIGGAGNDRLEGGPGVNRLEGGPGADTAVFAGAFAAYAVSAAPGGVTLSRPGEATTALSVETFLFADGARSLSAVLAAIPPPPTDPPTVMPPSGPTMGDDLLIGTPGPDRIAALGGNDTIRGLGGDDTLLGQRGDDVIRGGGGDDRMKGAAGADRLIGQGGDDVLRGGGGSDFLKGGFGADLLIGGGGADTLMGHKGDDTMKGGGGPDVFQFRPGHGDDVIQRFQQGKDQAEFLRGVAGFGDLTVTQQGDDVLVEYRRGSILFENQNAGAFGEEDFLF